MKDIRFGSIPEKYTDKNGQEQTSWQPAGYKAVIDWEARKLFVVDARTGGMIVFSEKRDKPKNEEPQEEEIQF